LICHHLKFESPEYVAEMLWEPATRLETVTEAIPELTDIRPRLVDPSVKVIVPVAPVANVAVKVTALPNDDGLTDELRFRPAEALFTVRKRVADEAAGLFVSPV
jgi:hypothetical protein